MSSKPVAKPLSYDFAQVLVTIGGMALSHYGAEGSVKFEYLTPEIRTSDVSADGYVHVVRNNDARMRCTITLKRVGPSNYWLRAFADAQRLSEENGAGLQTFQFDFLESVVPGGNGNGDACSEPYAFFETVAAPEFGKSEDEMEFAVILPNGRNVFRPGTTLASMAPTVPTPAI